ncbi:MAG: hypothetical protein JOZ10_18785 [Acidobacteria bacterium]|nr:hypothetical protein [Acidobacteriota bacterium]MBV9146119.1 hypothetical protein [Acidobacteriota bacterium]
MRKRAPLRGQRLSYSHLGYLALVPELADSCRTSQAQSAGGASEVTRMAANNGSGPVETMYEGPAVPMPWERQNQSVAAAPAPARKSDGTVYDGNNFTPQKQDTSVARQATQKTVRWQSLRFFIVGAFSLAEFFIFRDSSPAMAYAGLATALVFLAIGVFAFRMSRTAFLAGMIVYGLDTLQMVFLLLTTDAAMIFYLRPLIVHCIILYRLYRAYGLLTDLHQLENQ